MPKQRRNKPELFRMWFDSDPGGFRDILIKGNDLFCSVCGRFLNSAEKTRVTRHLKSYVSSRADDDVFFRVTK